MNMSNCGRRSLADMTVRELAELRLLNEGLFEAEHWIRQHAVKADSESSCALQTTHTRSHLSEDDGVRAQATFVLRESDPSFDRDGDNIIAKLEGEDLLSFVQDAHDGDVNELQGSMFGPLFNSRISRLFDVLYDHGLQRNWDALLRIGSVSIEISFGNEQHGWRLRRQSISHAGGRASAATIQLAKA